MQILLNGVSVTIHKPCTIEELIEKQGYSKKRIAMEINGEISPLSLCNARQLSDGDRIEIVAFVGGG